MLWSGEIKTGRENSFQWPCLQSVQGFKENIGLYPKVENVETAGQSSWLMSFRKKLEQIGTDETKNYT